MHSIIIKGYKLGDTREDRHHSMCQKMCQKCVTDSVTMVEPIEGSNTSCWQINHKKQQHTQN